MHDYQLTAKPQSTDNRRPVLTVRHPDVETLLKGMPSTVSGNWDDVRPWALELIRARNAWSIQNAGKKLNSLGRKN
ncbi:hypothetical protein [Parasphingorhabdus sp.]|uniref:hypothetical protein n=1 Tax=Parasphingorhabdus sp. TaxID=2709688 RepID=UPI003A92D433